MAEQAKLEQASVELVEMKALEESKDIPAGSTAGNTGNETNNGNTTNNDNLPDISSNTIISVTLEKKE